VQDLALTDKNIQKIVIQRNSKMKVIFSYKFCVVCTVGVLDFTMWRETHLKNNIKVPPVKATFQRSS